MSVQLGQVATLAAIAALVAKAKKAQSLAKLAGAAVVANAITNSSAANPSNLVTKFEPKIPNPNLAIAELEKCFELQLKLNLAFLNFKIPSINLSFALPKLPTITLPTLTLNIQKILACVAKALALLAAARALLNALKDSGDDSPATAAALAALKNAPSDEAQAAAAETVTATETTFYNPALYSNTAATQRSL